MVKNNYINLNRYQVRFKNKNFWNIDISLFKLNSKLNAINVKLLLKNTQNK